MSKIEESRNSKEIVLCKLAFDGIMKRLERIRLNCAIEGSVWTCDKIQELEDELREMWETGGL